MSLARNAFDTSTIGSTSRQTSSIEASRPRAPYQDRPRFEPPLRPPHQTAKEYADRWVEEELSRPSATAGRETGVHQSRALVPSSQSSLQKRDRESTTPSSGKSRDSKDEGSRGKGSKGKDLRGDAQKRRRD